MRVLRNPRQQGSWRLLLLLLLLLLHLAAAVAPPGAPLVVPVVGARVVVPAAAVVVAESSVGVPWLLKSCARGNCCPSGRPSGAFDLPRRSSASLAYPGSRCSRYRGPGSTPGLAE